MKSSFDNLFIIGSSHKTCQDYSVAQAMPTTAAAVPFIAVADGCSSSRDTDFGSRLLVRAALWNIPVLTAPATLIEQYTRFGIATIAAAQTFGRELGLYPEALDATLVMGCCRNNRFDLMFYGDGCALVQKQSGEQEIIEVSYESNAPYYLNYWLRDRGQERYIAEHGRQATVNRSVGSAVMDKKTEMVDCLAPIAFSFPAEDIATVIVMSDGAGSFMNETIHEPIGLDVVATEFLAFHNMKGEFLKRRVFKCVGQFAKNNIRHHDDLGVAACHFDWNEEEAP